MQHGGCVSLGDHLFVGVRAERDRCLQEWTSQLLRPPLSLGRHGEAPAPASRGSIPYRPHQPPLVKPRPGKREGEPHHSCLRDLRLEPGSASNARSPFAVEVRVEKDSGCHTTHATTKKDRGGFYLAESA
jgi:hypothetical protein